MSTHNIYFHTEIRKISILFGEKKKVFFYLELRVCLWRRVVMAKLRSGQSTQLLSC